jgi:hypothetical protein
MTWLRHSRQTDGRVAIYAGDATINLTKRTQSRESYIHELRR